MSFYLSVLSCMINEVLVTPAAYVLFLMIQTVSYFSYRFLSKSLYYFRGFKLFNHHHDVIS